ncbi:MAG: manganese efflux pump MntP family protein [Bacteroidia bacterium]|nr:manganese efflux pump MntP family protein [Bacteroidia bacterium]
MVHFFNILFVIALAYNTFPLALGQNRDHRNSHVKNVVMATIFGLIQGIMYHLGDLLGNTFMHLFIKRYKWVVFGILVAVAIRMAMEAFNIRKGSRLFSFDNYSKFIIMAVSAGINTFIIGMAGFHFMPYGSLLPMLLVGAGFAWSIAGISMNISRVNILLSSVLQFFASGALLIVAVLYLLTNLWVL